MTTAKPAPHKCPDCDRMFVSLTGLGSHRRTAHGIAGQSKTAIAYQKAAMKANALQCPECGEKFPAHLPQVLGSHRLRKHGISGGSKSAILDRRMKAMKPPPPDALVLNPLQCRECGFIAKDVGGFKLHGRKKHNIISPTARELKIKNPRTQKGTQIEPAQALTVTTSNGHHPSQADFIAASIPEAAIAFTAGRVEELLANAASQLDLPARTFTKRVIELVHAKTLW